MVEQRRTLIVTTPSDREIVMARDFDAPRELVFEAHTKPEHLRRWHGSAGWSLALCEIDLRAGGTWRYVFRNEDGREMTMRGVYREIVEPERIVSTEVFEGPELEEMGGETLNTIELSERGGRTTLVLTIRYQSKEARDSAMSTPMEEGAAEGYARLDAYLGELLRRT